MPVNPVHHAPGVAVEWLYAAADTEGSEGSELKGRRRGGETIWGVVTTITPGRGRGHGMPHLCLRCGCSFLQIFQLHNQKFLLLH